MHRARHERERERRRRYRAPSSPAHADQLRQRVQLVVRQLRAAAASSSEHGRSAPPRETTYPARSDSDRSVGIVEASTRRRRHLGTAIAARAGRTPERERPPSRPSTATSAGAQVIQPRLRDRAETTPRATRERRPARAGSGCPPHDGLRAGRRQNSSPSGGSSSRAAAARGTSRSAATSGGARRPRRACDATRARSAGVESPRRRRPPARAREPPACPPPPHQPRPSHCRSRVTA